MIACEATNHWTLGWVTLRDFAKIACFPQLILSLETARIVQSLSHFYRFWRRILLHIQYLSWHCLPGKGEGMINIGILSSSLRQRHFQHSNLGGWIDYREISGRGLVRRCRPYMFASLSKLHPSEWEVLGFEAQHGKFPLNRQIHSFRFEMLAQILGSKFSLVQVTSCVST